MWARFERSAGRFAAGIVLLLVSLTLLSACRSPGAATGAVATGAAPEELRVGIVADYPPFACLAGSGEPDGFDAALAQEIARRLNREIEWIDLPVSRLVETTRRGRVDLAIVSLRSLDELALPSGTEDSELQVENLGQRPSGELTVLLLDNDNAALSADIRAALAQMREQGVIQQFEEEYLAGR